MFDKVKVLKSLAKIFVGLFASNLVYNKLVLKPAILNDKDFENDLKSCSLLYEKSIKCQLSYILMGTTSNYLGIILKAKYLNILKQLFITII